MPPCFTPPDPLAVPTITAWSRRWQPCMYAVSMSMQCARLSLRAQESGYGPGWGTGVGMGLGLLTPACP